MIMVRKNELACRDEWSHDLWEARTGAGDAAPPPFVVPFPSGPLKPATETEIAAVLRSETGPAPAAPADVVLSEFGGASFRDPSTDSQPPALPADAEVTERSLPRDATAGSEPFARDALRRAHEAFREQTRATSRPDRPSEPTRWPAVSDLDADATPSLVSPTPPTEDDVSDGRASTLAASARHVDESALPIEPPTAASDWQSADLRTDTAAEPDADATGEAEARVEIDTAHIDVVVDDDNDDFHADRPSSRGFRFSSLLQWRPGHHARDLDRFPKHEGDDEAPRQSAFAERHLAPEDEGDAVFDLADAHDSRVTVQRGGPAVVSQRFDLDAEVRGSAQISEAERTPREREPAFADSSASEPAVREATEIDDAHERTGSAAGAEVEIGAPRDRIETAGDPAFAVPDWFPPDDVPAVAADADHFAVIDAPSFQDDDTEDVLPARIATGPRLCRACRDFRPAEDGERGWCANPWAFDHRQMVEASDTAPCAGAFGDWWLPKDVIWLDAGDISGHGLATPLLDAFVPSHRPEEPVRRRR